MCIPPLRRPARPGVSRILPSEHSEPLDDTTDADAAQLADSMAELAAGRKADDANVKERMVVLTAEFAAIIAELARVEK